MKLKSILFVLLFGALLQSFQKEAPRREVVFFDHTESDAAKLAEASHAPVNLVAISVFKICVFNSVLKAGPQTGAPLFFVL